MASHLQMLCCVFGLLAVQAMSEAAHGTSSMASEDKLETLLGQLKKGIHSVSEQMTGKLVGMIEGIEEKVKEKVELTRPSVKKEAQSVKQTIVNIGWTVIQRRDRRKNNNFVGSWAMYKKGFSSGSENFWLGNDKIHELTSRVPHELRITLEFNGKKYYANYGIFYIDNEKENYKLHIGKYSGTAGDSMTKEHNNMMFSTWDRDNDKYSGSCAKYCRGAWWYKSCYDANLNGHWRARGARGILWQSLHQTLPVTRTEMKIRPIQSETINEDRESFLKK